MFPSNHEVNESMRKLFADANCEMLSDFINRRTKVKYRCECGNTAEVRVDNFQRGTRCQSCSSKRRKNIYLEKFGVENISQCPEIMAKIKATKNLNKLKINEDKVIPEKKIQKEENEIIIKPKIKMSLKKPII